MPVTTIAPTVSNLVTVLFARKDSVYFEFPNVDVWDKERNALNWSGGTPVVAHPPCRAWGSLRQFAKPEPGEKELALWAVDRIRTYGGILEHPSRSQLWKAVPLPEPGEFDQYGGFTLPVLQFWWGHKAEKATRFYIVGCRPQQLPEIPFVLGEPLFNVTGNSRTPKGHPKWRPEIKKCEREATPPRLAEWMIEVARLCTVSP